MGGLVLALLWVGGAVAGWLPGTWVVAAQSWCWSVASLLVLAVSWRWEPILTLRTPGWWVAAVVGVGLTWLWRTPEAVPWVAQVVLWLLAGVALVERFGWTPLKRAVVILAWLQLPLVALQHAGVPVYSPEPSGTLGRRAILGAILGLASLWSAGWRAWVLTLGALATGSFTGGLIPLLRLSWTQLFLPRAWPLLVLGLCLTRRAWITALSTRWAVWAQTPTWIDAHWLTGWGLQQLPVGFQEFLQVGDRHFFSPVQDLHNTWLDVLARGGLLGLTALLLVMGWAWYQSLRSHTLWTWSFAVWVMTWQSVGAQPALLCVGLVWLFSLCQPGRLHVGPVQTVV